MSFVFSSEGIVSLRRGASFATKGSVLARWVAAHRDAINGACSATIGLFRRLISLPDDAFEWCGLDVCGSSVTDPRVAAAFARHDTDHIVRCEAPRHAHAPSRDVLAICDRSSADCGAAVLAARLFEVLLVECEQGLFLPRMLRADIVSAVLARFIVEQNEAIATLVRTVVKPFGETSGAPRWPDEAPAPRTRAPPAPVPRAAPAPAVQTPAPPAPPVPPAHVVQSTASLPIEFERDHAILSALSNVLARETQRNEVEVYATLDDVVRALRAISPCAAGKTDAALKQWVSHALKRTAQLAAPEVAGSVIYSSKRVRGGNGRVAGLVSNAVGAVGLLKFVRHALTRMAVDRTFSSTWFVSKAAAAHAKHVQKTFGSSDR
jgi:hypothetical protein